MALVHITDSKYRFNPVHVRGGKYRLNPVHVTDALLRGKNDRMCIEKTGDVMFQCAIQQHVLET